MVISSGGRRIIEKAIAKIPDNYPVKPFYIRGLQRIYNTIDDSAYFFKTDALISIYFPSYLKNELPQVKVLQNKTTLIEDSSKTKTLLLKFVGDFREPAINDFVRYYSEKFSVNKLDKYKFYFNGKTILNNRKVFIIDYETKANRKTENGTFYIDTATYAFVMKKKHRFNVVQLGFIPEDDVEDSITYQMINGKWFFQKVNIVARTVHEKMNVEGTIDFVATTVDTAFEAKSFAYKDVMQLMDENRNIKKTGDTILWKHYDSIITKNVNENNFSSLIEPKPVSQPSSKSSFSWCKKFMSNCLQYESSQNISINLALTTSPFSISSSNGNLNYQSSNQNFSAVSSASISSLSIFAIGIYYRFRIYKTIFFEAGGTNNYGIGGLNNSSHNYTLLNCFTFNKNHHPLHLDVFAGYNRIQITDKFGKFSSQDLSVNGYNFGNQNVKVSLQKQYQTILTGFTLAYEKRRTKHYFITVGYHFLRSEKNNILFKASNGTGFLNLNHHSESIDAANVSGQILPVDFSNFNIGIGIRYTIGTK